MRLKIVMTDRCNLMCDYCLVRVNQGPARSLDKEQILSAFAEYRKAAASVKAQVRGVSYGGGEPLLKAGVLLQTASALRGLDPSIRQDFHTNGLLLTAELFKALRDQEMLVVVSLDGNRVSHDRHRRGVRGEVSWTRTMERIEVVGAADMGVNLVFTPATVSRLTSNAAFLRRRGFLFVSIDPDTYHAGRVASWRGTALSGLSKASRDLAKYIDSELSAGCPPSMFPILMAADPKGTFMSPQTSRGLPDYLVLGADGGFYPPGVMNFPYEGLSALRCGGATEGFDGSKFGELFEQAARFVRGRFGSRTFPFSTANDYFYARIAGEDAGKMIAAHDRIYTKLLDPIRELSARWGPWPKERGHLENRRSRHGLD